MKKLSTLITATIIIIAVTVFASVVEHKANKQDAIDWLMSNGEKVINDDRSWYDTGPYSFTKSTIFFKFETDKHNVYWFKYSFFGRKIQKELPTGYQVIED